MIKIHLRGNLKRIYCNLEDFNAEIGRVKCARTTTESN